MPIAIVSRDAVLRDRLLDMCRGATFRTVSGYDVTGDIQSVAAGAVVLVHVTEHARRIRSEIQTLRKRCATVRIVLLTTAGLIDPVRAEFSAQVDAVVCDSHPIDTLIGALALVREGYRVMPPVDADTALPHQKPAEAGSKLSGREKMILRRLCAGGSNKEIANDLGIREATVKVHLRACFRKIGAKNRTQAAMWAVEKL